MGVGDRVGEPVVDVPVLGAQGAALEVERAFTVVRQLGVGVLNCEKPRRVSTSSLERSRSDGR